MSRILSRRITMLKSFWFLLVCRLVVGNAIIFGLIEMIDPTAHRLGEHVIMTLVVTAMMPITWKLVK